MEVAKCIQIIVNVWMDRVLKTWQTQDFQELARVQSLKEKKNKIKPVPTFQLLLYEIRAKSLRNHLLARHKLSQLFQNNVWLYGGMY